MKRPPKVTEEQLDEVAEQLAAKLTRLVHHLDAEDRKRWEHQERLWRRSLQGGRRA